MKILRFIRNIALITFVICLFVSVFYVYKNFFHSTKPDEIVIVDKISNFPYELDKSQTPIYQEYYYELKKVLNNVEINYQDYAICLSKLFVTDLFTLSNKVSRADIGGYEFIYEDYQDDFIEFAKESLYNSVKSNLYGNRDQKLPTVKSVTINSDDVKQGKFKYGDKIFDESYQVKCSIEYNEDYGYPSEYFVTLVKDDKLLKIVQGQ